MKPFVINRNSWHYKLNKHFMNSYSHVMKSQWEPKHGDFCSYWSTTIIRVIMAVLFSIAAAILVYMIGTAFYLYPVQSFKVVALLILCFAIIFTAIAIEAYLITRKKRANKKHESLLMQKYRAYKAKICPFVEYEE